MQVYQVWPRSFKDSNGDGIGDLGGVIEKLDYIKSLGTDMLWLSPVYASGNRDYGYDIDDYYTINSEFGTMEDMERLIAEARERGMGIMMDLVANHTSDRHEWFRKALETPDSPYRDYYIFEKGSMDAKGRRQPPNNWLSAFGGPAWQYHEASDSWYLTVFTPNQCDLNWDNPAVREGIYDIMRFWLDKGIAGYRMDVINTISKTPGLPNAGKRSDVLDFPFEHIVSLPKSHDYIREMYGKVLSRYPHCVTVGEGMVTDPESLNLYTRSDRKELDMMFHFDIQLLGCGALGKFDFRKFYRWSVRDLKRVAFRWMRESETGGGWIGNFMSNHDWPRQVSRFGDDKAFRRESAKAIALLNFTLRGTPYVYQGEEIGMTCIDLPRGDWRDYEAVNAFTALQNMLHAPAWVAERIVRKMSRDNSRTPMQWTAGKNAGFTDGESWIRINPNYPDINVESDLAREDSVIAFYRRLSGLRRERTELREGRFIPVLENHPSIVAFIRDDGNARSLVVINWSSRHAILGAIPELEGQAVSRNGAPLLATGAVNGFGTPMSLDPWEGLVYDFSR